MNILIVPVKMTAANKKIVDKVMGWMRTTHRSGWTRLPESAYQIQS